MFTLSVIFRTGEGGCGHQSVDYSNLDVVLRDFDIEVNSLQANFGGRVAIIYTAKEPRKSYMLRRTVVTDDGAILD